MPIENTVFLKKLPQAYETYAKSGVEVEYAVFAVESSSWELDEVKDILPRQINDLTRTNFFFSNIRTDGHYVMQVDRRGVLGVEHDEDKARKKLYAFAKEQAEDIANQRKWNLVEFLDKPGPLVLDPATNLPMGYHGPFGKHPNIKRGPYPGPKIKY